MKNLSSLLKKSLWYVIPHPFYHAIRLSYLKTRKALIPGISRPYRPSETTKAKARRDREEFFSKYCQGKGIDIGYGGDPITSDCDVWDIEHGDAQHLIDIPDNSYDFVYSSHTLEHLADPALALTNWWRTVKPGGVLLLYVPHRDLYERRTTLPSRWNPDHKHFFLPEIAEPPVTLGLRQLLRHAIPSGRLEYLKVCDEGYIVHEQDRESDGECSIEAVLKKPPESSKGDL